MGAKKSNDFEGSRVRTAERGGHSQGLRVQIEEGVRGGQSEGHVHQNAQPAEADRYCN